MKGSSTYIYTRLTLLSYSSRECNWRINALIIYLVCRLSRLYAYQVALVDQVGLRILHLETVRPSRLSWSLGHPCRPCHPVGNELAIIRIFVAHFCTTRRSYTALVKGALRCDNYFPRVKRCASTDCYTHDANDELIKRTRIYKWIALDDPLSRTQYQALLIIQERAFECN